MPGFTALARSDVELFRQVLSMYFTICALLVRKADTIVGKLFTRWSEDVRAILMSSEVEAHRQPLNPLVKKGHVADLSAALSPDNGLNLCKVNWGPPVGASCIKNLLCPVGLVVLGSAMNTQHPSCPCSTLSLSRIGRLILFLLRVLSKFPI